MVQADGAVSFISDKVIINEEFVQIAHEGRTPEKRFRFGGTCVEGSCKQWTGSRCGVIDQVIESVDAGKHLPDCSIRTQCRWYAQNGESACFVCPFVVTDLMVGEQTTGKENHHAEK
jgi:hypothetical protein